MNIYRNYRPPGPQGRLSISGDNLQCAVIERQAWSPTTAVQEEDGGKAITLMRTAEYRQNTTGWHAGVEKETGLT